MSAARWTTLRTAAEALDIAPAAMRRTIERRARPAEDGVLEASFDGIRARKFAGRWRVNLGARWTQEEQPIEDRKKRSARATFPLRPTHATRSEKE